MPAFHGSGKFALDKFKYGANQYPVVLAASNLVKNDFPGFVEAIQTLIEDVRKKYPVNGTIYLTGFSGGARMALSYALAHPVNGLIVCGALTGPDQLNALQCPVVAISGMDDFNFMETAQYLFQEQATPTNLKIELTDASHDWPDSLMLANALGFISLSRAGAEAAGSSLDAYCKRQHSRIDALEKKGDYLKAGTIARNMSSTEPFNQDKTFATAYHSIKSSSGYTAQLGKLKQQLSFEMSVRQPYIDAFQSKDMSWWNHEIDLSEEKLKTEKDPYTRDTYLRIKGFWGIACFTFGNQALQTHNSGMLNRIVPIYKRLEPENPYVYYFSAFTYFWKGDEATTVSMLKKALEKGFTDAAQLNKDFPASLISQLH